MPEPVVDPVAPAGGPLQEAARAVAPSASLGEGCPPPLTWTEVLRRFREESTEWECPRPGYTLRGRTWGQGPPVYFLNGMGGTHELYALLVYLLRDRFRCVLYDYPGTRRPLPPGLSRVSLADLAADLCAVADGQGDARFALYATSFGSLVAQQALLSAPGRIDRAVLQGGFARRSLSWAERGLIRACGTLPLDLRHVPLRKFVQGQNHRVWFPAQDATRWEFFQFDTGANPVAALAHRAALIRDTDFRAKLREIEAPVLLIRGEGDGLVATGCHDLLSAGLPHATTEWLHSTGHIPYLTHPHRMAKLVQAFCGEPLAAAT